MLQHQSAMPAKGARQVSQPFSHKSISGSRSSVSNSR